MKTYADYLATLTVKTLHAIARQAEITGYSNLRKVDLVGLLDDTIAILHSDVMIVDEDSVCDAESLSETVARTSGTPMTVFQRVSAYVRQNRAHKLTAKQARRYWKKMIKTDEPMITWDELRAIVL